MPTVLHHSGIDFAFIGIILGKVRTVADKTTSMMIGPILLLMCDLHLGLPFINILFVFAPLLALLHKSNLSSRSTITRLSYL